MRHFIHTNKILLAVIFHFSIFSLTGCNTVSYSKSTDRLKLYDRDTITALSAGESVEGEKGIVFVGKHFNYLLTKGSSRVEKVLASDLSNKDDIYISDETSLNFTTDSINFTGTTLLYYNIKDTDEQRKSELQALGFDCLKVRCTLFFDIGGRVYKKNLVQDESKLIKLKHPFQVGYYKKPGVLSKMATYPITIAMDTITLPLQLIAIAVILPTYKPMHF